MGPFITFFRYLSDFITQKVYFLRLTRVYVGLIMVAAYFCHSCYSQVEYNCSLIKVYLLAACICTKSGWLCIGRLALASA
jgi:hypothetical protein